MKATIKYDVHKPFFAVSCLTDRSVPSLGPSCEGLSLDGKRDIKLIERMAEQVLFLLASETLIADTSKFSCLYCTVSVNQRNLRVHVLKRHHDLNHLRLLNKQHQ